jgi:hypothetical protein
MFVFRGRDGLYCRPTNYFWPKNKEKNGTAQRRPSLPKMNEFLVGRVAEAYAGLSSVLVHNDMEMRSLAAAGSDSTSFHGADAAVTESLTSAFLRCLLVKRRGASG